MEKSESIKELASALAKAQLVFSPIKQSEKVGYDGKEGRPGKHYTYAPLVEVIDACRKGLSENGLAIMQPTMMVDDKLVVETLLAHSSGEWIKSEIRIDSVEKSPQGVGSALTYARRYALSALLGVASEQDDDGEAGTKDGDKKPKSKKLTEPRQTTTTGAERKEHWCTEHSVAYWKFEKEGRTWYSHKQGDVWCNEDKGKARAEVAKPEPKAVIAPKTPEQKEVDGIFDKPVPQGAGEKVAGTEHTGKPPLGGTQSGSVPGHAPSEQEVQEIADILQLIKDAKMPGNTLQTILSSPPINKPTTELSGKTPREVVMVLDHDQRLALCSKLNERIALK